MKEISLSKEMWIFQTSFCFEHTKTKTGLNHQLIKNMYPCPKKPDFGSKLKVWVLILALLNFLMSHTNVAQNQNPLFSSGRFSF